MLTTEQIEQIAYLREVESVPAIRLAERFGVSPSLISWHCMKQGAVPQSTRRRKPGDRGPMVTFRHGKPVRRFTPEEDERLIEMALSGMDNRAIGRGLGRADTSVAARLATLARREDAGHG